MKRLVSTALVLLVAGCASTPQESEQAKKEAAVPAEQSAAAAAVPAPVPERAAQEFARAVQLLEANKLADAELELKNLALAFPQFAGPHINLGLLYERSGKLEDAAKSLNEAVKIDPKNALAYTELGLVYRKQGKFKDAEGAYSKAIEANADYAPAYLNLGVLCDLYLQEPQRALEAFERYQQLTAQPDPAVSVKSDEQLLKQVANWIAELKSRLGSNSAPRAAEAPTS